MVILEVPEFQYDIVKSRGAVWDDKIKKWCADRKHLNALCEWIPYYKESYYYGKEVQGINTIELQEFDKFFDNNIDIINQYLYLCIANIKCPHCCHHCNRKSPHDTEWSPHHTAAAHPYPCCDAAENRLRDISQECSHKK